MPLKDEKTFTHIRLREKGTKALKRVIRDTRRSLNEEANIACENHGSAHDSRKTGK